MVLDAYRGGGAWSPAALSPVEWWDFSDSSTRTDISSAISQITSKGSGGRTAAQTTSGYRPAISLAAQNGLDVAVFDGADDCLLLSSSLTTSATMTVVEVFGRASPGIYSFPLGGSAPGGEPYSTQWWTDNVRYSALWGYGYGYATHGSASSSTGVFLHVTNKGASTTALYAAGALVGTPQTTRGGSGNLTYIGRRGSTYHNGMLCEIVVIGSALADADREKIEGYMAHKWGLAGDLPSGHPYKSAPP